MHILRNFIRNNFFLSCCKNYLDYCLEILFGFIQLRVGSIFVAPNSKRNCIRFGFIFSVHFSKLVGIVGFWVLKTVFKSFSFLLYRCIYILIHVIHELFRVLWHSHYWILFCMWHTNCSPWHSHSWCWSQ